jgi:hypothetical protein
MKTRFLFPRKFIWIGWIAVIVSIILFFLNELPFFNLKTFAMINNEVFRDTEYFKVIRDNLQFEIASILLIVGLIFIAFSKVKNEDEFTSKLRLESLLWATYINYGLLLLTIMFVYGLVFLNVMAYNFFTILIVFIIRFRFVLWKSFKSEKS